METSRRDFLRSAAAGALATGAGTVARAATPPTGFASMTRDAMPISAAEYAQRLARIQSLMQERRVAALLVESGSTLEYFTGVRWRRSERITAALIPAAGTVVVVTPYFEEPSVRETLRIAADVRPWKEDQSPFTLLAAAWSAAGATGPLAVESTTRFLLLEQLGRAATRRPEFVMGDELVNACRMIKSAAELALMQVANEVTLAALRYVHGHLAPGMPAADIFGLMVAATEQLGGAHEFSLVLLNEASAYPHGSILPQQVRNGSVILIDTGCSVHGYQSDITRTWVFGEATARQREVWEMVHHGQELALASARLGVAAGAVDRAVRDFYEQHGWSRDYGLPGLSHRTGHGIGLDVHEAPYLVRNDPTPLQAGMCFSDEPGIYIPGEFGIRLEDCWHMTATGPKTFTPLARSIERPF